MQMPIRPENNHKTLSEETVKKVLAQRHAETEPEESDRMKMISLKVPETLLCAVTGWQKAKSDTVPGFIKLASLSIWSHSRTNRKRDQLLLEH